jgi:hypothetical protein
MLTVLQTIYLWLITNADGTELNLKSLTGEKSRLWHRVAHGKCVEVDYGAGIRWGYSQLRHMVPHTPCFSSDSVSALFPFTCLCWTSYCWYLTRPSPQGWRHSRSGNPHLLSAHQCSISAQNKKLSLWTPFARFFKGGGGGLRKQRMGKAIPKYCFLPASNISWTQFYRTECYFLVNFRSPIKKTENLFMKIYFFKYGWQAPLQKSEWKQMKKNPPWHRWRWVLRSALFHWWKSIRSVQSREPASTTRLSSSHSPACTITYPMD